MYVCSVLLKAYFNNLALCFDQSSLVLQAWISKPINFFMRNKCYGGLCSWKLQHVTVVGGYSLAVLYTGDALPVSGELRLSFCIYIFSVLRLPCNLTFSHLLIGLGLFINIKMISEMPSIFISGVTLYLITCTPAGI